jgi:hypothetical protein
MLHERIIRVPPERFGQLFCSYTAVTILELVEKALECQGNTSRWHVIFSGWHMIHSLTKERKEISEIDETYQKECPEYAGSHTFLK